MTFTEQLLEKRKGVREWTLVILIWCGAAAVAAGAFGAVVWLASLTEAPLTTPLITWCIVAGLLAFAAVWLSKTQYIEFEYSVYEGGLDVDRITGKRRRRRVVQVPASKIETLLPYTDEVMSRPFDRTVMAAPSAAEATWYLTYHSKKNGHTLVLLAPNERTLAALYEGQPPIAKRDIEQKCREMGRQLP